jgi:hypothetical protein
MALGKVMVVTIPSVYILTILYQNMKKVMFYTQAMRQ